ncbi:MAG TPA: DUF6428 family protein [Terrimicrobiaceae bacterium]|nr:DUF6428 family protein [Terrimicrobiaceae bacterium]
MNTSEFRTHLTNHPDHELRFQLPDGGFIAAHAHITEVGRLDRTFLDCGGTKRRTSTCLLQSWVAEDTDHRITAGKLAAIFDRADELLGEDDLPVEIEHEEEWISQFPVVGAEAAGGILLFRLGLKHTDCLAKDVCLPEPREPGCCTGTGCC